MMFVGLSEQVWVELHHCPGSANECNLTSSAHGMRFGAAEVNFFEVFKVKLPMNTADMWFLRQSPILHRLDLCILSDITEKQSVVINVLQCIP